MKTIQAKKYGYAITATLMLMSVFLPLFNVGRAGAAQLVDRSLTMSDSGASGQAITSGVGSGTNVSYQLEFTMSGNIDGLIIDFCANSPLIGDTCSSSVGGGMSLTNFTAASAAIGVGTNDVGEIDNWTSVTASQYRITLAKGTGSTASTATQVFTLTGITNPSVRGTFYARIYTYASAADLATYSNPTSIGTNLDYGGFAMSIVQIIQITAKVQESLQFCVTGLNPSQWTVKDCNDTTAAGVAPSLLLGHGTPSPTLDASMVDSGTVFSQLSTNATSGASIAMRNSNNVDTSPPSGPPCTNGGLSSDFGDTCFIPGVGDTPALITAGTAAFGLFVWNSEAADLSSVVGDLAPTAMYHTAGQTDFETSSGAGNVPLATFTAANNAAAAGPNYSGDIYPVVSDVYYAMDDTTAEGAGSPYGNVLTTFGSVVASCTAPVYKVNTAYTFAATASLTTPAGIYAANIDLIATGTF